MKKIFLVGIILLAAINFSFAQTDSTWMFKNMNAVNANFLGNGVLYSFSYERIYLNKNRIKITSEAGANYFIAMLFPASVNLLIRLKNNDYLSIGTGATVFSATNLFFVHNGLRFVYIGTIPWLKLGYRYQSRDERFIFKAEVFPFLIHDFDLTPPAKFKKNYTLLPWAGLTVGYAF